MTPRRRPPHKRSIQPFLHVRTWLLAMPTLVNKRTIHFLPHILTHKVSGWFRTKCWGFEGQIAENPGQSAPSVANVRLHGGGGGIRTHGTLSRTPVFKTGAFDHSATPPQHAPPRAPGSIRQTHISRPAPAPPLGKFADLPCAVFSSAARSGYSAPKPLSEGRRACRSNGATFSRDMGRGARRQQARTSKA